MLDLMGVLILNKKRIYTLFKCSCDTKILYGPSHKENLCTFQKLGPIRSRGSSNKIQ